MTKSPVSTTGIIWWLLTTVVAVILLGAAAWAEQQMKTDKELRDEITASTKRLVLMEQHYAVIEERWKLVDMKLDLVLTKEKACLNGK